MVDRKYKKKKKKKSRRSIESWLEKSLEEYAF